MTTPGAAETWAWDPVAALAARKAVFTAYLRDLNRARRDNAALRASGIEPGHPSLYEAS